MINELKTPGAPLGKGSARQDSPALSERNRSESRAPTRSVLRFCGSTARACALPPKGPASLQPPRSGKAAKTKANLIKDCMTLEADLVTRVPKEFGKRLRS